MASEIKVDTISEKTSANGVTIDGVNIKDSALATAGSVPLSTIDIDGGTDIGAAIVDADLFIIDDGAGGTNRKVAASRIKTYAGGSDPASADGDTLGTASLEWSDLYLADGGQILFGNDQEITLTHSADSGLLLKHTATADDKPINLVLQTGETDMAANDVIGKISWQAPDEGTGTDAILVSAAIQAVAEGDHSSSSNATRLEFMTGASEAAAEKMTLTSAGVLNTTKLGVITDHDLGVGIHVRTSDTGCAIDTGADELILEGTGANVGLSILSDNDWGGKIIFSDPDDADVGFILYNHNNNDLDIHVNATLALRMNSAGTLLLMGDTENYVRRNGDHTDVAGTNNVHLIHTGGTDRSLFYNGGNFGAIDDDHCDLGGANERWDDVYATNGTIQTSDATKKDNIQNSSLGLDFVNKLTPRQYKYKDWTSPEVLFTENDIRGAVLYDSSDTLPEGKSIGDIKVPAKKVGDVKTEATAHTHTRTHYGLIAQEVETVLTDMGLTTTDFAPLIKSPVLDSDGNATGNHNYGMRYTELVGVLIKSIQELSAKVKTLEDA